MTFSELIENWDLFGDSIYAAGIAGGVLGFLGVYIVLRRMVFVSAAVTQGAGLGVAAVFYLGANFTWMHGLDPSYGAILFSVVIAAVLAIDPTRIGLTREAMLGAMFVFASAAVVIVQSKIPEEAQDISAIIFGTGVLVLPEDLAQLWKAGIVVMALHVWWFRGFTFASFDRMTARVQGVPVVILDLAMLLTIGIMIGVTARALGALPSFALSTLPAAAALVLTRGRLAVTFALAAFFGMAAGVGGYVLAFMKGLEGMGAVQSICAVAILLMALLIRGGLDLARGQRTRS